jgi:hypothetical protein
MVLTRHKPRPDEALIPCATAQPVVRPRAVPAPRPTRPAGIAREVLAELRAAEVVMPPLQSATCGTHDRGTWLPASAGLARVPLTTPRPLPTRDLIERCAAVSTAMHADYERHLDTLAVLDGISAAIADGADAHVVRMALAPVEALLKGSVSL